jgi:hypothetical protein
MALASSLPLSRIDVGAGASAQKADECRALAKGQHDADFCAMMLQLAEQWDRLATHHERMRLRWAPKNRR